MTSDVIAISTKLNAMLNERPVPTVGIHPNVPFHTYLRWDAASNSALGKLRQSPAHLQAYLEGGDKDTAAKLIGRATHCALLEPHDFEKRYAIGPEERRSNADKSKFVELEMRYGPGHVLRPAEFEQCLRIRDGVYRYESARGLLEGRGETELSIAWIDPDTGLLCKARIDKMAYDLAGGAMVDLKSTTDASKQAFASTIWDYKYHCQGALYLGGSFELQIAAQHYVILAYEKEPPYGVGVYRVDEGTLSAGETEVRPLLALYNECRTKNEWPGYPDKVDDIALPSYAWNRINAQEMGA